MQTSVIQKTGELLNTMKQRKLTHFREQDTISGSTEMNFIMCITGLAVTVFSRPILNLLEKGKKMIERLDGWFVSQQMQNRLITVPLHTATVLPFFNGDL